MCLTSEAVCPRSLLMHADSSRKSSNGGIVVPAGSCRGLPVALHEFEIGFELSARSA